MCSPSDDSQFFILATFHRLLYFRFMQIACHILGALCPFIYEWKKYINMPECLSNILWPQKYYGDKFYGTTFFSASFIQTALAQITNKKYTKYTKMVNLVNLNVPSVWSQWKRIVTNGNTKKFSARDYTRTSLHIQFSSTILRRRWWIINNNSL